MHGKHRYRRTEIADGGLMIVLDTLQPETANYPTEKAEGKTETN